MNLFQIGYTFYEIKKNENVCRWWMMVTILNNTEFSIFIQEKKNDCQYFKRKFLCSSSHLVPLPGLMRGWRAIKHLVTHEMILTRMENNNLCRYSQKCIEVPNIMTPIKGFSNIVHVESAGMAWLSCCIQWRRFNDIFVKTSSHFTIIVDNDCLHYSFHIRFTPVEWRRHVELKVYFIFLLVSP